MQRTDKRRMHKKAREREPPKIRKGKHHGIRDRPDYTQYCFSGKEWGQCAVSYLILDLAVSYLFFNSIKVFLVLFPGIYLFQREMKRELLQKRRREMCRQFLDGMQMTASALQAGYSIENAFREALKELQKVYEEDSFIIQEFLFLTMQIRMNRNVEELLVDLGKRSGIEDIRSFAEIVETAKRTGGDLLMIIRNTVSSMRQRQETMAEIETCLAGKVMEQNVMSLIPVLILAYVRFTSPEFLESMYESMTGTAVMTVCLMVYAAAVMWGKRIVQIEV